MSEIVFTCAKCGTEIEADESVAGVMAACPNCNATVVIPMPGIKMGMEIAGYRVERRLGMGGMGEVWLAMQIAMERKVALKILSPALTSDAEFVGRFLKEVKLAAKLEHPNVVTAFDAGVEGRIHYLAMSYVDGILLEDLLAQEKQMAERKALGIARGVAEALCYAWGEYHILHRDIKPANIMLDSRGTPKLMDMGISKSMSEDKGLTMAGMIIGTPYYMSPEQARADAEIDCRSDIYALGATLYHLVAGKVPYDATTAMGILTKHITEPFPPPRLENPAISEACSVLLEAMMAKKPEHRPKDWAMAIADMDLVMAGKFPRTTRPSVGASLVMSDTVSQALSRRKSFKAPPKAKLARHHAPGERRPPAASPQSRVSAARKSPGAGSWPMVVGLAVVVLACLGWLLVRGGRGASPPPVEVMPLVAEVAVPVEPEAGRQARLAEEAAATARRQQEAWEVAAKFAEQALTQGGNLDVAIANLEKAKRIGAGTQYEIKADVEIAKLTAAKRKIEEERRRVAEEQRLAEIERQRAVAVSAQQSREEQAAAKLLAERRAQLLQDCAGLVMAGDFRTAANRLEASGLRQDLSGLAETLAILADEGAAFAGSFRDDLGREIEVELANGAKEKIKPVEIRGGVLMVEVRVGTGTMRRAYAPEAFSDAERLRRLASASRAAAAMKLLAGAVKAGNLVGAGRYVSHCGELADGIAVALAAAEKRQDDDAPPVSAVAPAEVPDDTLAPGTLPPDLLVYEGFDYSVGGLADQDGGHGFSKAWILSEGVGQLDAEVVDGGLSYARNGVHLMVSGKSARTGLGSPPWRFCELPRPLDLAGMPNELKTPDGKLGKVGTTLWFSFLVRLDDIPDHQGRSPTDIGWWAGIKLGGRCGWFGRSANAANWGIELPRVDSPVPVAYGQTAFLVQKVEFTDQGALTTLWVNPSPALDGKVLAPPEKPDLADRLQKGYSFDRILLASSCAANIDEIRIGTSYHAVAPGRSSAAMPAVAPPSAPCIIAPEELFAALKAKNPELDDQLRGDVKLVNGNLEMWFAKASGLRDLSPLRGVPLVKLNVERTAVTDLSPLVGMPLVYLHISGIATTTDFSFLRGMPLEELYLAHTKIADLSLLADMPLRLLQLHSCRNVSDLSPLAGITTLINLQLAGCQGITCLEPLRGMKLEKVHASRSGISDLAPLAGHPLNELLIDGTAVADLTPLVGMPLEWLIFSPGNVVKGIDVVRGIKSLKGIGTKYNWSFDDLQTPVEFWREFDAQGGR